ncbi:MAG: hypothetical protein OI718_00025 (plasmid) [Candidatus Methanoperedens sp.]|nr:MAG: hypothetical protein OI718_00025 [Candidatus Methanoperedens sp.]
MKKELLVVTQGTLFFKISAREILGGKYFSTLKALKTFTSSNGFGFITINPAEEQLLPHVLNGGCPVAKIYGSQRMVAYDFWNTERIRMHSLCQKCDGACIQTRCTKSGSDTYRMSQGCSVGFQKTGTHNA